MHSFIVIICIPFALWQIMTILRVYFIQGLVSYPWRRQWQPTPVLLPGKSHGRRSLVGCSPWLLSDFTFTFHFPALEKAMATHSSVLAWRIPGTGDPGGLPSMGSHRVGHDWSDLAAAAAAAVSYPQSQCSPSFPLSLPFSFPLFFFFPPSPFSYFLFLLGSVLGFEDTLKQTLCPQ